MASRSSDVEPIRKDKINSQERNFFRKAAEPYRGQPAPKGALLMGIIAEVDRHFPQLSSMPEVDRKKFRATKAYKAYKAWFLVEVLPVMLMWDGLQKIGFEEDLNALAGMFGKELLDELKKVARQGVPDTTASKPEIPQQRGLNIVGGGVLPAPTYQHVPVARAYNPAPVAQVPTPTPVPVMRVPNPAASFNPGAIIVKAVRTQMPLMDLKIMLQNVCKGKVTGLDIFNAQCPKGVMRLCDPKVKNLADFKTEAKSILAETNGERPWSRDPEIHQLYEICAHEDYRSVQELIDKLRQLSLFKEAIPEIERFVI